MTDKAATDAVVDRLKYRVDLVVVFFVLATIACLIAWIWTADWRPFATSTVLLVVTLAVRHLWVDTVDRVADEVRKELGL